MRVHLSQAYSLSLLFASEQSHGFFFALFASHQSAHAICPFLDRVGAAS